MSWKLGDNEFLKKELLFEVEFNSFLIVNVHEGNIYALVTPVFEIFDISPEISGIYRVSVLTDMINPSDGRLEDISINFPYIVNISIYFHQVSM